MMIGALSAYGVQPYVYNTNIVSSASMNKLSRISDDVLDKKIDYSELADESKNINPLKKGQTLDFQSMLQMQMQRGQNNAARIMRPAEDTTDGAEETAQASGAVVAQFGGAFVQAAAADDITEAGDVNAVKPASGESAGAADTGSGSISYQMQQALNAYEMFMTA